MAIEDFFDHECSIFHVKKENKSPGYGLEESPVYSYGAIPDIETSPCHFYVRNSSINIVQNEPEKRYEDHVKLALPIGTDIRLNDLVVNKETGMKYEAEIPKNIRGHHIAVYLNRQGIKGAL